MEVVRSLIAAAGWPGPLPLSASEFEATRARWAGYAASRRLRVKAFAYKASFRLIVPRNPMLARNVPWRRR